MRHAGFTWHDGALLAQGLGVSLGLFAGTFLIGLVLGSAAAVLRHFRVPTLGTLLHTGLELLRNSPVLVQLFLVFFGVPALLHQPLTPVFAAGLTLSANTAAFVYFIAVAGLDAVGRDQVEAARAFGLSRVQLVRHILGPQALAFAVAPLVGLAVNQLQVTSLVSVIGVVDLTKAGDILNLRTLRPFAVWTLVGVLYFAAAKTLTLLGNRWERRLRAHAAPLGL
ncbi:polar amino acid transport system permease protein [Nitrospirillum amazonense]|uniref:Polar amino acid transport system permease protein n=1 Tax=Nitrospirillum amazonense TaxID=28077 RepID=A0A560JQR0_9PROT|nr:amino acid ABC transporter permease [Nitrospirillum amazonense]TWB73277.1 polar amino acid transport system permease protein [Nitrospirillum amazonense]